MPAVTYALDGPVATITMDDGKVNALSLSMLTEVHAALDRAASDGAVVVLAGREGRFSGGFDLGVLNAGGNDALAMLRAGLHVAGAPAVVPDAGGHRVHRSRDRDGGVHTPLGRLPHRRGGSVQDHRQRGRHRARTAPDRGRDLPPAADAGALQPSVEPRRGLLTRGRGRRRLPRPCRAARGPRGCRARGRDRARASSTCAAHAISKRLTRADVLAAIRAALDAEFPPVDPAVDPSG